MASFTSLPYELKSQILEHHTNNKITSIIDHCSQLEESSDAIAAYHGRVDLAPLAFTSRAMLREIMQHLRSRFSKFRRYDYCNEREDW